MNKETLLENIFHYCTLKKIKPTPACAEAGVGKDFIVNVRNGKTPSVAKVATLAAYLGVTTSDLVGDARASPDAVILSQPRSSIQASYDQLNEEGQERLQAYADDLIASGRYIKSEAAKLG